MKYIKKNGKLWRMTNKAHRSAVMNQAIRGSYPIEKMGTEVDITDFDEMSVNDLRESLGWAPVRDLNEKKVIKMVM